MTESLLALENVSQVFRTRQGQVRAVDDVSLAVEPGQVICLVGESGSGKTTSAKIAAGLRRPTSGAVRFNGQDIWRMDRGQFRAYRRPSSTSTRIRMHRSIRFTRSLIPCPPRCVITVWCAAAPRPCNVPATCW